MSEKHVIAEGGLRIADCGMSEMTPSDLKRRTFEFGVRCVKLVDSLPKGLAAQTIGKQLLRAATSVGANYRSASRARSHAEFIAKLGIVEDESDETMYWIELLNALEFVPANRSSSLLQEANEITAIIVASIKTARSNKK